MRIVNHLLSFLAVAGLTRLKKLSKYLTNSHFCRKVRNDGTTERNAATFRPPLLVCGYAPHPHPNTQTKREACETSIPKECGWMGCNPSRAFTVPARPDHYDPKNYVQNQSKPLRPARTEISLTRPDHYDRKSVQNQSKPLRPAPTDISIQPELTTTTQK